MSNREQAGLTNSLPFIVQYRRKDDGIRWVDMAAYDSQMVAERYRDTCAGDNSPWEYRVEDRSPAVRAALANGDGK